MSPYLAAVWAWAAWVVSWIVAAIWSSRTKARANFGAELPYRIVTVIGLVLLFFRPRRGLLTLWSAPPAAQWGLVALIVAGFAFCWWARLHLGRLWSGTVTLKTDHRIVDTGPYRLVRHPIYTGLILSAAATGALRASAISFVGVLVIVLGFWLKARLEERWLREQLGAEAYDAYARRTGMLFPGL